MVAINEDQSFCLLLSVFHDIDIIEKSKKIKVQKILNLSECFPTDSG